MRHYNSGSSFLLRTVKTKRFPPSNFHRSSPWFFVNIRKIHRFFTHFSPSFNQKSSLIIHLSLLLPRNIRFLQNFTIILYKTRKNPLISFYLGIFSVSLNIPQSFLSSVIKFLNISIQISNYIMRMVINIPLTKRQTHSKSIFCVYQLQSLFKNSRFNSPI